VLAREGLQVLLFLEARGLKIIKILFEEAVGCGKISFFSVEVRND